MAEKKKAAPKKKSTPKKAAANPKKKAATKKSASKAQAKVATPAAKKPENIKKNTEEKKWGITVALLIGILLILLVLIGIALTLSPSEDVKEETELKDQEGLQLVVIEDSGCLVCQTDLFAEQVKANLFPDLNVVKIDANSEEGKEILSSLGSKTTPVYLFSEEVTQDPNWETQLASAFEKVTIGESPYYKLQDMLVPIKYVIDAPEVTDSAIVVGDENAPLTIIEFSDYECPFCGIAEGNEELLEAFRAQSPNYEPPVPKIFEEYVETGKVKFVYYNFPLEDIHPNARDAHNAALCAAEQDNWRAYSEKLYLDRNSWIEASDREAVFYSFAIKTGVEDEDAFRDCYNERRYDIQIDEELELGSSYSITGTPAFFIGKHFIPGAIDYSSFKDLIEKELAR